eukprot:TRINITY_DN7017_c0_g1_i2.p1 TRINITY_DN7017_c0_g1~~TRINITY_DN7017_c0_g1_i2.p1  ORF type:complete len:146 (-),score=19.16 TRINITY_DN7017_c0_g1_i2:34-471(-)
MSVTVVSIELVDRSGNRVATSTETRVVNNNNRESTVRELLSNFRTNCLRIDRNTSGRIHKKKHRCKHNHESSDNVDENYSILEEPYFKRHITEPNRRGAKKVLDCLKLLKVQTPREEPSIKPLSGGGCLFYFRDDVQFQNRTRFL